jgi:tetratricopeptide (TPR) repeat protein
MRLKTGFILCIVLVFVTFQANATEKHGFVIDRENILTHSSSFSGHSFEELSMFFYGGSSMYARELRELNQKERAEFLTDAEYFNTSKQFHYFAPKYPVQAGDTFQAIGARFAGGSARSYLSILHLKGQHHDPEQLAIGDWVVLPRIPFPVEQIAYEILWCRNLPPPCSFKKEFAEMQIPTSPIKLPEREDIPFEMFVGRSYFNPSSIEEMLDLWEWYQARLEVSKDRDRLDGMVSKLLEENHDGWRVNYSAGHYYYQTGNYIKSIELLSKALKDENAPIQVAFFFLQAIKQARFELNNDEVKVIMNRFPALKAVMEADDK